MAKRTDTNHLRDRLSKAHGRLVAAVEAWSGPGDNEHELAGLDWSDEMWRRLPAPEMLEGEAPSGLWDFLASKVRAAGFALRRGHCDGNNGMANNRERIVWISPDLSDAQACGTLAHELAHVILHCGQDAAGREVEVEAESVAYLICHVAGLATDASSFPYVALWGGLEAGVLRSTTAVVLGATQAILSGSVFDCDKAA